MRKIEVEELDPVRRRLAVEIPQDEVEAELSRVFRELEQSVRVPGFRPGRVPRRVLEQYFGKRVRSEVADRLIGDSLRDALREKDIRPVGRPQLTAGEVAAGQPLRYSVTLEVKPEIELHSYRGLQAQRRVPRVTDEDVDRMLQRMRQRAASLVPIADRSELRDGDFADLQYEAWRRGKRIAGGESELFMVDSSAPPSAPGHHLVGMKVGEEREFDLPAGDEETSSPPVRFACKLRRILERRLPELDDEFARDQGDVDSLAELREKIREVLVRQAEHMADEQLRRELVDRLVTEHDPDVPEAMVDSRAEQLARELLMQSGAPPPTATREQELLASLAQRLRPDARRQVQAELVLEAIARREDLQVSDAELEGEVEKRASVAGPEAERVRRLYQMPELRESLREKLLRERALDLVVQSAVVETVSVDSSVADAESSG